MAVKGVTLLAQAMAVFGGQDVYSCDFFPLVFLPFQVSHRFLAVKGLTPCNQLRQRQFLAVEGLNLAFNMGLDSLRLSVGYPLLST